MDAVEQYISRLLDEAPPLTPEQGALIVRTFARKTPDASSPASDAA